MRKATKPIRKASSRGVAVVVVQSRHMQVSILLPMLLTAPCMYRSLYVVKKASLELF